MSCATLQQPTLRAHSAPVPSVERVHRREVARWALATGRPANRDALAAIIGTRAATLPDPSGLLHPTAWTTAGIGSMLWTDVADWCDVAGVALPAATDVSDTLDTYLRHLSACRLIASGSDPVAALRRAIFEYGGRRSAHHPSLRRAALAPVVPIA